VLASAPSGTAAGDRGTCPSCPGQDCEPWHLGRRGSCHDVVTTRVTYPAPRRHILRWFAQVRRRCVDVGRYPETARNQAASDDGSEGWGFESLRARPSGAPSSEALSVSVEAPRLIIDDSFDDLTGGTDRWCGDCGHLRTELCDRRQHGPLRVTEYFSKPNSESRSKGVSARMLEGSGEGRTTGPQAPACFGG
jgi:hypothetical protein